MSLFQRLFHRPEPEIEPADLAVVGVDMHSHFIPGIDDGAPDPEASLLLLKHMQDMGYRKAITTPHVFTDLYPNSNETIRSGAEKLRPLMKERGLTIELEAAAEYYLDEHFEMLIEKKDLLTFGKNYVLFEISFAQEPANLGRAIFHMHLNGYKPILAHPERYEFWHSRFSHYEAMVDKDVRLQLNINSLTGQYGPGVKRMSEKLIDAGMISFLGSDCHHPGHIELMQAARKTPALKRLIESGALLNPTLC